MQHNTVQHLAHLLMLSFLLACLSACGANDGRKVIPASDANKGFLALSVEDATARLGPPDSKVVQGDGLVRHTWVFRRETVIPERTVRLVFSRENSFPSDRYRTIPEKTEIEYCNFAIFTNDEGIMKDITQEGNACHLLVQSRQAGFRVNGIPQAN